MLLENRNAVIYRGWSTLAKELGPQGVRVITLQTGGTVAD
jgi:hypothetical protein